jgi:hypothetical protein
MHVTQLLAVARSFFPGRTDETHAQIRPPPVMHELSAHGMHAGNN